MVRFRISHGVNFLGDIDVELFNSSKPLTVSNFLVYAQNDVYRNSILHRCAPGSTLHGGQWTVGSPTDFSFLQSVTRIPVGSPITNEFQRGGVVSNVFGTLAMGKPPGSTNGATAHWFFNLGDNSDGTGSTNLNTADGGYTVFGRVTSGNNILNLFNARALNQGILDTSNAFYRGACSAISLQPDNTTGYPFDALPVAFTNANSCPTYRDLFTVQVLIVSGGDTTPPVLTVTSPAANGRVSNDTVSVTGTVTDGTSVEVVRVYWNTNSPLTATRTNNQWSVLLTNVPPGTNTLIVEAVDAVGLRSQINRTFFRSILVPLTLDIVGAGTVTGATNGQLLELTRGYKLVARPNASNLFAAWTGDFPQDNPTLQFVMGSNTTVTAVFGTNLFPYLRGTYNGLFFDQTQVEQHSSGYLTMAVSSAGAYSGRLLMNGRSHRFSGSFFVDGFETNVIPRPGTNGLRLQLALDLTNGTERLTGTVTNNQITAINPAQGWSAQLAADRAVFDGRTMIATQAGRYTLLMPADAIAAGPDGDGFGTANVTTKGAVSLSATLADGTRATQKTGLSRDGLWPLYIPLHNGKGAMISWVQFTNETATDLAGLANWFKQSQPGAKYYRAGFTNELTLVGSRYTPPTATNRVLNFTNALAGFTDGNIAAAFSNAVRLELNNKIVNLASNKLTMRLTKGSGLFNGTVTPPGATRSTAFKGAVLQKQNRGGGFLLGTNASARVTFAE